MGIWLWSVDSNMRIWDENLGRLFELLPDERASTYEGCIQRVHPDGRAMVDGSARRVGVEGRDLDNDLGALLADGRVRWIANRGRCLRHP
jgi:hypothetical protein